MTSRRKEGDGPLRDTEQDQDVEHDVEKARKHHVPLEANIKQRIEHFTW